MVIMYKRYLAPMSVHEKQSLSRKLVSFFNISRSASTVVNDAESEIDSVSNDLIRKEERRQRVYRELADAQIEEILRTMRSLNTMQTLDEHEEETSS